MEDRESPATEKTTVTPVPRVRLRVLRHIRFPEILMAAGLVLIAVAGISHWTQANSSAPSAPAFVQPTPFPTAVPPAATETPAATARPSATQQAPASTALPAVTAQPSATEQPLESTAAPTAIPATPTRVVLPTVPRPTATFVVPVPARSAPSRIVIPSIDVDAPVVEVGWVVVDRDGQLTTEWEVADYAAGFHQGSAYPGNPGNTVLSGHNNMRGKVFRYLADVAVGDEIILYADGNAYSYHVESVEILPEKYASEEQRTKNAQFIGYFPDDRLTLVTCWPYTSNTHRVIVIARPALLPADAQ